MSYSNSLEVYVRNFERYITSQEPSFNSFLGKDFKDPGPDGNGGIFG